MKSILVIDDQPCTRFRVEKAMKDSGYIIMSISNSALTERMIEVVKPDLVLINQQPYGFDSISVFMSLREKYPDLAVLLYALQSDTAVKSLKQAVAMAFKELGQTMRKVINPPVPGLMTREVQVFKAG